MTVKILQETTSWNDTEHRKPNHVYLMAGDKIYAYSAWGTGSAEYLRSPIRINRGGRKFVEISQNPWQFDLSAVPDVAEIEPPGKTWQVLGSKGNQYSVALVSGRWSCTCAGHGFRGRCRHVDEVSASVQR